MDQYDLAYPPPARSRWRGCGSDNKTPEYSGTQPGLCCSHTTQCSSAPKKNRLRCRSLRQPTHPNIALVQRPHWKRLWRVRRPTAPGAAMIAARRQTSSRGTRRCLCSARLICANTNLAGFVPEGRDLASALARGEVELVKTSGSTSDAVTNVWCQEWWDASEASSWKLHAATASARLGDHREAILASPRCVGFASEVGYLTMEQRTLWHYLFLTEKADPAQWSPILCDRMIEELGRFEPTVLEANPSFLSVLCRHAIKHNRRVYRPAVVTLTYENPSLIHLRHVRRVFQCPVVSSYGATESGYVFMQCEAGRLHQNVDHCHVDFQPLADRHGGPMVGRILVSTFNNPWRALIRFDMGDLVRLAAEPCPCGRHEGLTLDAIEGRVANATLSLCRQAGDPARGRCGDGERRWHRPVRGGANRRHDGIGAHRERCRRCAHDRAAIVCVAATTLWLRRDHHLQAGSGLVAGHGRQVSTEQSRIRYRHREFPREGAMSRRKPVFLIAGDPRSRHPAADPCCEGVRQLRSLFSFNGVHRRGQ